MPYDNNKYIKDFIANLNKTGESIKKFQNFLITLPKDKNANNNNSEKDINLSEEKEISAFERKRELQLLAHSKLIYQNILVCQENLKNNNNIEIPDKIFDTLIFLEIKYVDLNNIYFAYLDCSLSMNTLLILYQNFENKSNEFIKKKLKYIFSLIKVSLGIFQSYSEIQNSYDNNNNNYNSNNIDKDLNSISNDNFKPELDIKKNIYDIFNFIYKILSGKDILSNIQIQSIIPGIVSKIVKLISNEKKILSSKSYKIMIKILYIFLDITIINKNTIKETDIKNFYEFLEVFLVLSFQKYDKEISKNLMEFCNLISLYLKNANKNIINESFSNIIFLYLNKIIFKDVFGEDINLYLNMKNIIKDYKELSKYEEFYKSYRLNENFDLERVISYIKNSKDILMISYNKKEFIKFNNNLIDFCGFFNVYLYYIDNINFFENEEKNKLIENELIPLCEYIFKLNKEKIIMEIINSYELQFKNLSIEDYKFEIISQFFNSVLNSYNKEMNLPILFGFIKHIYMKKPDIMNFIFRKIMEKSMKHIKKFNSSLINNAYNTRDKLNNAIIELLNMSLIFQLLITFQYPSSIDLSLYNHQKKLKSILHLFYSMFADISNEEYFEVAKIPIIYIQLINLFLINLSIFTFENKGEYMINEINELIILAMINFSNNSKIMKFSSFLLVLYINQYTNGDNTNENENNNNLKCFIENNFPFLIHTVLNRVIYFEQISADFKQKSNSNYMKRVILNFFSSLIDLIKTTNDFTFSKFYFSEFIDYVKKLFPYLDLNIKEKKLIVLDILLEILIKISEFQKQIFLPEFQDYLEKKREMEKTGKDEDEIDEVNEERNDEGKPIGIRKKLMMSFKLENANTIRQLILRLQPLILSKNIRLTNKSIQILKNYINILYVFPMEREEGINFSSEDPNNVTIPRSLGPILFELWNPILFAIKSSCNTIINTNLFIDLFREVSELKPDFFDHERIFKDLLPILFNIFDELKKIYTKKMMSKMIQNFYEFFKQIIITNKYKVKYKENIQQFWFSYQEFIFYEKSKEDIDKLEKEFKFLLFKLSS